MITLKALESSITLELDLLISENTLFCRETRNDVQKLQSILTMQSL